MARIPAPRSGRPSRGPLVAPGPELDAGEVERYSRQLRMPQLGVEGQRRLKAARVLVLGAGGLGSPVLLYLAAAGVGTLGIVDDDTVDVSNLQRQTIHTTAAVGGSKARSAAAAIRGLNPLVRVELHETRLVPSNAVGLFEEYDLVVDATDNFETRYLANDTAAALGMPYVWGAVLRFDGQVSTFWGGPGAAADGDVEAAAGVEAAADAEAAARVEAAADVEAAAGAEAAAGEARDGDAGDVPRSNGGVTLRDLFPVAPADDAGETCSVAGVLGPLCGSVGAAMATEAMKLIVGFGDLLFGRVLVFDAFDGSVASVTFRSDDGGAERDAGNRPQAPAADPVRTPTPTRAPSPAPARTPAPSITVAELAERLADRAAGRAGFVLLDVREPWEFEVAAIEGAVLVPLSEVISAETRRAVPPESTVVVHCHHDTRSQIARDALRQAGYSDVTFVEGGIDAWSREIAPSLPRY